MTSALLLALLASVPFTATEMMRLQRLADPQLSPDGRLVAYQSTQIDLGAGTRNADVWVVPVAGGAPRRITDDPRSDSRPRWSPDGRRLAFISNREGNVRAGSSGQLISPHEAKLLDPEGQPIKHKARSMAGLV